ncbi:ATP-binding protein [Acrocarpospora catenulata]|uniref:ATP-binding protein n=1 Tax=Acrocarpospora catenulata TaxID=2836182 RepID=UPI001BDA0852|nr:ATP-binding protein [Acrocarpospora catenulata]
MVVRRIYQHLVTHPVSVALAREQVRAKLMEWGRRDLIDSAELIVTELVTNGIRATLDDLKVKHGVDDESDGGTDESDEIDDGMRVIDPETGEPLMGMVGVTIYRVPDGAVIEVWDPSRQPPRLVEPRADAISGRGLLLVDAVSQDWGYRRPASGGKVVYARIGAAS